VAGKGTAARAEEPREQGAAFVGQDPAGHLEPGVVEAHSTPTTGILDLGRYPTGTDEVSEAVAAALERSTYVSVARPDIMRWKYGKLLMNLGNGISALCGPMARSGDIYRPLRQEAIEVYKAAGIDFVDRDEDRERRGNHLQIKPIDGELRVGGSTWQSLTRGLPSVETDYLNGEIVLLGRLHGIPTPANAFMQDRMARAVLEKTPPGSVDIEALGAEMESAVATATVR
jgi:2-dehydropantoate 2-reductase